LFELVLVGVGVAVQAEEIDRGVIGVHRWSSRSI
jgi:hypothetical protein